MASTPFSLLILLISCWVLLISPAHSQNCASQKFSGNRTFPNCTDLTTLSAVLHFNYNASNSSLSVAYTAAPSKTGGWVAWAINPNGSGMIGAQALIAFKLNNNVTVKTYNLVSYGSIKQEKLSFDVWDLSAGEANGKITIFATVKLPDKAENVSQVWQVGPSVTNGQPDKHDFGTANLASKGVLTLVGASANTTSGSGNTTGSTSGSGNTTGNTSGSGNTTGNNNSGASSVIGGRIGVGLYTGLLLLLSGLF
ncbi:hypothetical protein L6164_000350 [Bauhinia variegata]|uniref:Uncharacterized protein n=1 Tax=Bauhinia variegata TaxID=167791 RepID=A0ACB9Q669_BAUVA|nr:hypothetical protein L6164_000350 [Bauhinia variegata]